MASPITFGTDGWRATIGEEYTFDNVRIAAQASAAAFANTGQADRGIVVGYDTRFGSDRFARAVVEVLAGNGIRAYLSNRFQPTPVLSYSVIDRQAGGGIIITASHNPGADNGFKVKTEAGSSAPPEVIEGIEREIVKIDADGGIAAVRRLPFAQAMEKGLVEEFDAIPPYDAHVSQLLDLPKLRSAGLTVVADAMFGTGIGAFERFLSGGSTRVKQIRAQINPAFPGIAPEPIRPHIDALCDAVKSEKADIGLATDGDSDRIGPVSNDGSFINQHQVFGLLLLYLVERRTMRGPAVRSATMTSMGDKYLERRGLRMIETAVGFKYIGGTMVEQDAILGGEESGGFGFRGHIPERDAILAGLYLIDLMVGLGKPMTEVLDHLRAEMGDWHYHRVDVRYPTNHRDAIAQRVAEARPSALDGSPVTSVGTRDGYKYYAQDGSWLLIRFSGTEPLLRIYTETTSGDRVQRILAEGQSLAGV